MKNNTTNAPIKRRQRFAYIYAKGYPVAEAAREAGYAETTATRNGAKILQGKRMKLLVERYQKAFGAIETEIMPATIERLMAIIRSKEAPTRQVLSATRALTQIVKQQGHRPLSALGRDAKTAQRQHNDHSTPAQRPPVVKPQPNTQTIA